MKQFCTHHAMALRIIMLLFAVNIGAVGSLRAQSEKIVFPARQTTIQDAFDVIERQTEYLISINHINFDISKRVRLSSPELTLANALEQLLSGTERDYIISHNHILVVPVKKKQTAAIQINEIGQQDISEVTRREEFTPVLTDTNIETRIRNPFVVDPGEFRFQKKTHLEMAVEVIARTAYLKNPPRFGIKMNFLYGIATYSPNIGIEFGTGKKSTVELWGSYNGWNLNGSDTDNKKLAHWTAMTEYRYWFCERFNGHFLGVHGFYTKYNIAEHNLNFIFGSGSKEHRYKGTMVGAGISYGYHWMVHKNWNIEFNIGVGYGRLHYDKFDCSNCGNRVDKGVNRNYIGPTKMGISLVYLIK